MLEGEAKAALAWLQWAGLHGRPILSKVGKLSYNEHTQHEHTHFHPSGSTEVSPEDLDFTRNLIEAGRLLDIIVLDHLIIANGAYQSVVRLLLEQQMEKEQ